MLFEFDTIDKAEQDAAAHVLNVRVHHGVVQTLRKVVDRVTKLLVIQLLANVVNQIGNNATRIRLERFRSREAIATNDKIVEEYSNVRKKLYFIRGTKLNF
jgi:hypothetical protein